MYKINEDLSIYVTRGDIVLMSVAADFNGKPYTFMPGDLVRIKVYKRKKATDGVLEKDFPVTTATQKVQIYLTEKDTKIGEVISKPTPYWYEVELNPDTEPQTIIGYDEDGAKIFMLFPEGADEEVGDYEPDEEDRYMDYAALVREMSQLEYSHKKTQETVADMHITPQMYGAIGDGVSDDTEAIQKMIDDPMVTSVYFDKKYLVSAPGAYKGAINLASNKAYTFANGAEIRLAPNAYEGCYILKAENIRNFSIIDAVLYGDKEGHKGTVGAFGDGLFLKGCKDFYINSIKVYDTWGDGVAIYDGSDGTTLENGHIGHIYANGVSRNGVTLESCHNLTIDSIYCENINRVEPMACLDMEQDFADYTWDGLKIGRIVSKNCVGGVQIAPYHSNESADNHNVDVAIDDITIEGEGRLKITPFLSDKYSGLIHIKNVVQRDTSNRMSIDCSALSGVLVVIDNILFKNIGKVSDSLGTDATLMISQVNEGFAGGNLHLNNIELVSCAPRYSIAVVGLSNNAHFVNCKINIKADKPMWNNITSKVLDNAIDWCDSEIVLDVANFSTYQTEGSWFTHHFVGTKYINSKNNNTNLVFPTGFPIRNKRITIYNEKQNNGNKFGRDDWNIIPASLNLGHFITPVDVGAQFVFTVDNVGNIIVDRKNGEIVGSTT